jgi:hypothetical protein
MATTMEEVRAVLDPEEPDYQKGAELGPDAIPHLQTLVNGDDAMLASKAAYLASLIKSDASADVVRDAAHSKVEAVRVAAAAAARNLPSAKASEVLEELVGDDDPGVRKVARDAVPRRPSSRLAERLAETESDSESMTVRPQGQGSAFTPTSPTMPGETASTGMPGGGTGRMPGEEDPGMPDNRGSGRGGPGSMPN